MKLIYTVYDRPNHLDIIDELFKWLAANFDDLDYSLYVKWMSKNENKMVEFPPGEYYVESPSSEYYFDKMITISADTPGEMVLEFYDKNSYHLFCLIYKDMLEDNLDVIKDIYGNVINLQWKIC